MEALSLLPRGGTVNPQFLAGFGGAGFISRCEQTDANPTRAILLKDVQSACGTDSDGDSDIWLGVCCSLRMAVI